MKLKRINHNQVSHREYKDSKCKIVNAQFEDMASVLYQIQMSLPKTVCGAHRFVSIMCILL